MALTVGTDTFATLAAFKLRFVQISARFAAAEILAFLRFDMFDEDGLGSFDDTVGMCRYAEGETPFNGEIVTLVCDPDPVLMHAGFTLRWQLVPG